MTHNLVVNYGLYRQMEVFRPKPVSAALMTRFQLGMKGVSMGFSRNRWPASRIFWANSSTAFSSLWIYQRHTNRLCQRCKAVYRVRAGPRTTQGVEAGDQADPRVAAPVAGLR